MIDYRRSETNRYHLSAKAFILNQDLEILLLHGEDIPMWNVHFDHFYSLMSETVEPGESPEAAVVRGAVEELNAMIEPLQFFGSRQVPIDNFAGMNFLWHKTSLYFICKFVSSQPRQADDVANTAALEWMSLAQASAGLDKTYDKHDEFKVDGEVVHELEAYLKTPVAAELLARLKA